MNLELLQDVQAARLGLPYDLGLVGRRGDVLENVLPVVAEKLKRDGLARETTKRATKPQERKPTGPREIKPIKPKETK